MKPIVTPETNAVFVKEGCDDLPAMKCIDENNQNCILTAWEVSPAELKKLQETGIIYLVTVGETIPPVWLGVEYQIDGGDKRANVPPN